MPDIPLRDFAATTTQADAAQQLGVTQSGLSQMLRSTRRIFVRIDRSGRVIEAYEVRPIGAKKPDALSA